MCDVDNGLSVKTDVAVKKPAPVPSENRDKDVEEAVEKLAAARRVVELMEFEGIKLTKAAEAVAREIQGVSVRSLIRWVHQYQQGVSDGDELRYLIPQWRGITDWHREPWVATVLARYRQPQRPDLADAVRKARADLEAAGWPEEALPSYEAARRWIKKLPIRVRERGRMNGAAMKALLPFKRRDWSWMNSNDVWVGDGHTFKAKVQHPIHGQAFAPEVTVVIDAASRLAVGWAISLSENCIAVSEAIGNGMINYGRPLIYYSDNGAGQTAKFLDHEVTGILKRFGVRHETGIPGNPQGRGLIERLWGTVMIPLARTYPSYQGTDVDPLALQRVTRDINKAARQGTVPSYLPSWKQFFDEVEQALKLYNLEHIHSDLRKTPAQAYAEKLALDSVMTLSEREKLEVFRPEVTRVVNRGEINLFNNRYASQALENWHRKTVRVLFDMHDASDVWVRDMQGRQIAIAKFNGNSVDGFNKPMVERLRENRVEQALKRLEEQQRTMRLELTKTLDAEIIDITASELRDLALDAETRAERIERERRKELARELEEGARIIEAEQSAIEAPKAPEIVVDDEPEPIETQPSNVVNLPVYGRPNNEDLPLLEWLSAHPDEMTQQDRAWIAERSRANRFFDREVKNLFGNDFLTQQGNENEG